MRRVPPRHQIVRGFENPGSRGVDDAEHVEFVGDRPARVLVVGVRRIVREPQARPATSARAALKDSCSAHSLTAPDLADRPEVRIPMRLEGLGGTAPDPGQCRRGVVHPSTRRSCRRSRIQTIWRNPE